MKRINRSDDYRIPACHKDGGLALNDSEMIAKYRQVGRDMVKQVGKSILMGQFNLTNVSFPIKCMMPKSILEVVASVGCIFPSYMNAAALATDPVERMKYTICGSVAWVSFTHTFDKPLNPILGETYQA
mmetsp:Transcript_15329/g.14912  ORF Transcript_15329/g.14912 Transcript_15329/m.14912 type:complete len:129 (+) Transcript_15329:802-1188(+)